MDNKGLISKFVAGATEGTNSNKTLKIDAYDLVNYKTVIACRLGNTIMISNEKYSSTTARIINELACQAERAGLTVDWAEHSRLNEKEYQKLPVGSKV